MHSKAPMTQDNAGNNDGNNMTITVIMTVYGNDNTVKTFANIFGLISFYICKFTSCKNYR